MVKTVVANDDVASAPKERHKKGVAGEVLMWKIGGAKLLLAETWMRSSQLLEAIDNTRSVGIGLTLYHTSRGSSEF